jgi:hypothetical protein
MCELYDLLFSVPPRGSISFHVPQTGLIVTVNPNSNGTRTVIVSSSNGKEIFYNRTTGTTGVSPEPPAMREFCRYDELMESNRERHELLLRWAREIAQMDVLKIGGQGPPPDPREEGDPEAYHDLEAPEKPFNPSTLPTR